MLPRIALFLEAVTNWAQSQPDVQALALVGSHAREAARPDSDVDLVIICTKPNRLLQYQEWAAQFGSITRTQIEDYGLLTSLRAWYADGLEVEYGITGEQWAASPLDPGTRRLMEDGIVVLFERDDVLSRHLPADRHDAHRDQARGSPAPR